MTRTLHRLSLGALAALPAILANPAIQTANAQYFGRNKVKYESFHFQVLKTEHFDIYYYGEERGPAEDAARMAERWYARLSRILDHELRGRQPIILYANQSAFRQTTAIPGEIGEGTGGVTQIIKRRIVLPLAGPLSETDHVIGHELVHAFQFDITGEAGTGPVLEAPGAARLPLWFVEGMAEYLSLGPVDANTAMWMRDAAFNGKFPKITDLENPRYFPYRYGQALWAYIGGRWGDEQIGKILEAASEARDPYAALSQVLGTPVDSLSEAWREATVSDYETLSQQTEAPTVYGHALIQHEAQHDVYNLAPALSPDGRQVVFLSERGLYSIEMYLADAETGQVERKMTSAALDPHLQSLEFINSAGSWNPDGRRFVYAAIEAEQPVLEIVDTQSGKIERQIKVPGVEAIYTPSWSADGQRIAFSGSAGGTLDLYMLDVQSGKVSRLTDDAYADLQPVWSPDGRQLAFATDRFRTDLAHLSYDGYDLALLDVQSGAIEALPTFPDARNIDPQWGPDGSSLYFVSDRDGVSDLYRLELQGGRLTQVTNLLTGISGITALSPAISVARTSGRLAYSVYEKGGYDIYSIDPSELQGRPVTSEPAVARADLLPPRGRAEGIVREALSDATTGLPQQTTFASRPYHAGLSLDYVAPPTLTVGTGPFGTLIGGGSALYFSDMLGQRYLTTALQVNGGVKDIGALVGYSNVRTRWNWGVSASQVPYLTGGFAQGLAEVNGDTVLAQQAFLFRETDRQVSGLVQYPFNPAQRIELAAGYTNVSFSGEVRTQLYSLGGAPLDYSKQDLPVPSGLNLGNASVALVYDNALFGSTSPILGQRYRLEVTPTVGSLNLVSALADYRRYVMPVWRVTLAVRLLHYGRWGGDAQDERLYPLFIGYQPLVRGYNTGSFDASECQPDARSTCPVFDQLFGSRILVGNLEARVPLVGALGLVRTRSLPPLDLAAFLDGGVAWWGSAGSFESRGLGRLNTNLDNPISSYGAALRMNLYGFAVLEMDLVHPNDRPGKGWFLEFGLTPGF
jgi:Tol biopolymer transport system component